MDLPYGFCRMGPSLPGASLSGHEECHHRAWATSWRPSGQAEVEAGVLPLLGLWAPFSPFGWQSSSQLQPESQKWRDGNSAHLGKSLGSTSHPSSPLGQRRAVADPQRALQGRKSHSQLWDSTPKSDVMGVHKNWDWGERTWQLIRCGTGQKACPPPRMQQEHWAQEDRSRASFLEDRG